MNFMVDNGYASGLTSSQISEALHVNGISSVQPRYDTLITDKTFTVVQENSALVEFRP